MVGSPSLSLQGRAVVRLLVFILNQCGIRVKLSLCNGDILLVLSPTVSTIAILVGNEHGGSLAGAYEIPVALAFTHELKVALIDDVVLCDACDSIQTCTLTNQAHILCSCSSVSARLQY